MTSLFSQDRLRRTVTALLCCELLLSACTATARTPMPVARTAPVRATPQFSAPSAADCARPIQTREVPGATMTQGIASSREHGRFAGKAAGGRADLRMAEAAPAPAAALAAPMPPPAAAPAPSARSELADASRAAKSGIAVEAAPRQNAGAVQIEQQRPQAVTAGMVDDNASFADYLAFRARTQVQHRARDISERYLLEVKDTKGQGIPDAEVAVQAPSGHAMWARTDTAGRVWLHPNAFDPGRSQAYEVVARKDGRQSSAVLMRGQKSAVEVRLDHVAAAARAKLDLVFLIDATGSMADEIDKLKATLHSIAADVARLPSQPDLCFGLVAYRDKTDAFVLRSHNFTNDLGAFQGVLNNLHAAGGGDYPEAMNEALNATVHSLSWRGAGATRLVVLLADAPPHLDYGGPQYDDDMVAALGKGIKIFSVGASGLDKQGEYIQRQIAQYTGGRFVFLTYAQANNPASGPGRETVHDVNNYSVETLDKLIVRLVTEELGKLPQSSAPLAAAQAPKKSGL
jgi:Mg-chelatase subunit ChlD